MKFFIVVLGLFLISGLFLDIPSQEPAASEKKRAASAAGRYRGPVIDAHNHPKRKDHHLQAFFEQAREANVEKVVVMTTPNEFRKHGNDMLRNSRSYPGAVALCTANFVGFIHRKNEERARREFEWMKADLTSGVCGGVGEVGLRHYDKTAKEGGSNRGQDVVLVDLNHPLVLEMLGLADGRGAPVVLHIEPVYSPAGIDNLSKVKNWYKRICRRFPGAKLIAAHNGMMSPGDLEALFSSCGNLFADFKFMHNRGSITGFQDLHPMNGLDSGLFPQWRKMIGKYPGRFLFASDWKYGRRGSFEDYTGHIRAVREMLGVLPPAVQRKVLYENAKRVFSID